MDKNRADQIAEARAALQARYDADPQAVASFRSRMANIEAARKRERDRFETKVLGRSPALPAVGPKPKGMSRAEWRIEKRRRQEAALADMSLAAKWSHKQGTPETHEHASRTHEGALVQLHANGTIDNEQLEWAAQIANVYRSIASSVDVAVASLEARVDQSARPPAVAERIHRVRMHAAYTLWRSMLPAPKALVLDMIVGDAIGYTVAAKRHRVHNRKALRLLLEAIRRWPMCVMHVFSIVDERAVNDMNMARAPLNPADWMMPPATSEPYHRARAVEAGRDKTDEPYLLPAVDPAFLDEHGRFRPWDQIAAIVREKAFGTLAMEEAA